MHARHRTIFAAPIFPSRRRIYVTRVFYRIRPRLSCARAAFKMIRTNHRAYCYSDTIFRAPMRRARSPLRGLIFIYSLVVDSRKNREASCRRNNRNDTRFARFSRFHREQIESIPLNFSNNANIFIYIYTHI